MRAAGVRKIYAEPDIPMKALGVWRGLPCPVVPSRALEERIYSRRSVKREEELAHIRAAQDVTDRVFLEALNYIHAGMTDIEIQRMVGMLFYEMGSQMDSFDHVRLRPGYRQAARKADGTRGPARRFRHAGYRRQCGRLWLRYDAHGRHRRGRCGEAGDLQSGSRGAERGHTGGPRRRGLLCGGRRRAAADQRRRLRAVFPASASGTPSGAEGKRGRGSARATQACFAPAL